MVTKKKAMSTKACTPYSDYISARFSPARSMLVKKIKILKLDFGRNITKYN